MAETRPPATYVHGLDGPTVVVPGRIAAILVRYGGLNEFRRTQRGLDSELDSVLEGIAHCARAWLRYRSAGSDHGTELAEQSSDDPESPLTTAGVAALLAISDRGVRKAIADGRLPATRLGDVWLIDRQAVEMFRSTRSNGGSE